MPEYEFSVENDLGNPNSIMMRVTAQLRDEELEHWRQKLEEAYKMGWQNCQFELRAPGRPYELEKSPYSKENFAKLLTGSQDERT